MRAMGGGVKEAGFIHATDDVIDKNTGHATDEQGLGKHDLVMAPAQTAAPAFDSFGGADDPSPIEEIKAGVVAENIFFAALIALANDLPIVIGDGVWEADFHGGRYSPSDSL